jgi:pilus assembly protein Flp/PilA
MEIQKIKEAVVKFIKDEEGLTIVEYAVAGALITVFVVAAFTDLGTAVGTVISEMCTAVGGTDCSAGA